MYNNCVFSSSDYLKLACMLHASNRVICVARLRACMQVLDSLELVCMYHSGYVSLQEKHSYKASIIPSTDKKTCVHTETIEYRLACS